MGGLSLIHLGFLAATAAVAVPVLIHLLLRPRARKVEIGTIWFLKQVLKDSTRRRKVRRWLLLALRMAVIFLLALLFARPYLRDFAAMGREREVVLMIDQSASMATIQSGQTLFARAQEAAAKVLGELPEQTATHLVYFDSRGVSAVADGRIDRTRQAGFASTDYGQALGWARDTLVFSNRPYRKVYLFTDFQRSESGRNACEGFPKDAAVEVVEVGKPLLSNLAIERTEATATLLRSGEPIVISARVRNAGAFPARNVRVRLVLSSVAQEGAGTQLKDQVQTVSLDPVSDQLLQFTPPIEKPGLYTGYVEVETPDEFPLDNRRWLAFEAQSPDRLLLVDGQPGITVHANETYYLEMALRLRLPGKGSPLTPYEPERLAWLGSPRSEGAHLPDLSSFRVVVICNVDQLAESDIDRLRAFVSGGGRLLIFTGDQVTPEGYEPMQRAGLLPGSPLRSQESDKVATELDLLRFATWDKDHPVFRPFIDPQHGDLRRIGFRHITKVKPAPDSKTLATAQTGDPLLLESRLDRGIILLFTSAADRDWSDWPQSPLYVPLINQIMGYLTGRLLEGQRITSPLTGPGRNNPPGITRNGEVVLVRNLDPKESELERFTVEQFRKTFDLPEFESSEKKREAATEKVSAGSQRPDELWPYVIWALLILLLVELLFANRTYA
jgi:hypothetical protein